MPSLIAKNGFACLEANGFERREDDEKVRLPFKVTKEIKNQNQSRKEQLFPTKKSKKPRTNDYEDEVKDKHNKKVRLHVPPQNNYTRATEYQETGRSEKPTMSIVGDSMIQGIRKQDLQRQVSENKSYVETFPGGNH